MDSMWVNAKARRMESVTEFEMVTMMELTTATYLGQSLDESTVRWLVLDSTWALLTVHLSV